MKDTPTSGPVSTSITHHERELSSSRNSLSRSHDHGVLGKRKKNLFEIARIGFAGAAYGEIRKFLRGTLCANLAAIQENEAIADSRSVRDLMDRQKQSPAFTRTPAQGLDSLANLPEVEAVKRFVDQQQRLWRKKSYRKQSTLALAFG
jgi:hypothetical protein